MVGLCGQFNSEDPDTSSIANHLSFGHEYQSKYSDKRIEVQTVTHDQVSQPALASDDALVWVWGNVYSHRSSNTRYVPKYESHPNRTTAEYCAQLFDQHGFSFVEGLNSEFAIVILDQDKEEIHLITDRLGSRPIYIYETDQTTIFSTNMQALALHPDVKTDFNEEHLQLYFELDYVPGERTPLRRIRRLPPASVVSIDLSEGGEQTTRRYWKPQYQPVKKPKSYFTKELETRLGKSLGEKLSEEDDIGLMLSGGSDSRLLAGLTPQEITCYHMNDWENTEYEIASRTASITDNEFKFLRRDREYPRTVLEKGAHLHEFIGNFYQAHAGGFRNILSAENDILLSGLYADTLFKGYLLPRRWLRTPLGKLRLPLFDEDAITRISNYVETRVSNNTDFLNSQPSSKTVVRNQIVENNDNIEYGGVEYPDLQTLLFSGSYYPLTNQPDYLFQSNLAQIANVHVPFLDNRIIDLHLSVPIQYQLRGQLIKETVSKSQPKLSELKHPGTGIALKRSFLTQYLAKNFRLLVQKYTSSEEYDESYYTDSGWPDRGDLIRESDFVKSKLDAHEDCLKFMDLLDIDKVDELYKNHHSGENHYPELHRVLSILEMPITHRIMEESYREEEPDQSNN